jgi:hypothetical protein
MSDALSEAQESDTRDNPKVRALARKSPCCPANHSISNLCCDHLVPYWTNEEQISATEILRPAGGILLGAAREVPARLQDGRGRVGHPAVRGYGPYQLRDATGMPILRRLKGPRRRSHCSMQRREHFK